MQNKKKKSDANTYGKWRLLVLNVTSITWELCHLKDRFCRTFKTMVDLTDFVLNVFYLHSTSIIIYYAEYPLIHYPIEFSSQPRGILKCVSVIYPLPSRDVG
jgi:hypothetical protein